MNTEAEIGVMCLEVKKPKMASDHQKLGGTHGKCLSQSPQKE